MMPTPWMVTLMRWSAGVKDEYGDPTAEYVEEDLWLHGLAPGAMDLDQPNRNAEEVLWTLYAPGGTTVASQDLIILPWDPATQYEVNGRSKDWTKGPWDYPDAGVVIELRKVAG